MNNEQTFRTLGKIRSGIGKAGDVAREWLEELLMRRFIFLDPASQSYKLTTNGEAFYFKAEEEQMRTGGSLDQRIYNALTHIKEGFPKLDQVMLNNLLVTELVEFKPLSKQKEVIITPEGFEFMKRFCGLSPEHKHDAELSDRRRAAVSFEVELRELLREHMETDLTLTEAVGSLHLCAAEITHQFFNNQ